MKQKKFLLNWYQANDTAAMERKMEHLAEEGWLLERVSNWGWHMRRGEAARVRYAVTYFPDASVFDGRPTEGQQTYADYCRAAGWEFVSAYGPMQFFRSTRPDAAPIETDEAEKLQAIHRSMLKTWVLSYGILLLSMLLNLSTRMDTLRRRPMDVLASNGQLALIFLLGFFLVFILLFLGDYFLWYVRSKKSVERGGACLQPHTKARLAATWLLLIVCAAAILAWVSDVSTPGQAWVWVYAFVGMAVIMALSQGIMALMKRKGCSREATKIVFFTAVFLLSVAYAGGMVPLVLRLGDADLMEEKDYAYLYTDERGREKEIYRDALPVTLEDLGYTVAAEDHCSYWAEENRSVLVKQNNYTQRAWNNSELPDLVIEVTEFRWDWLQERCLERLLFIRPYSTMLEREDPRWGAEQVYAPPVSGGADSFLLVYEDALVYIDAGWTLTDEQVSVITQKLNIA